MSEMIEGTLEDIRLAAREAGDYIEVITAHWTAGWRDHANSTDLADYHILVLGDGSYLYRTDFTEELAHSWHDNSNNLGIAVCACVGATSTDLGDQAPLEIQYEAMCKAVKVICEELGLDIDSTFYTHAERADMYDYGPATTCERWDLAILHTGDTWMSGGDKLREMAKG